MSQNGSTVTISLLKFFKLFPVLGQIIQGFPFHPLPAIHFLTFPLPLLPLSRYPFIIYSTTPLCLFRFLPFIFLHPSSFVFARPILTLSITIPPFHSCACLHEICGTWNQVPSIYGSYLHNGQLTARIITSSVLGQNDGAISGTVVPDSGSRQG